LIDVTIPGSLEGRQISDQDLKIAGILTFDTYLSDSYTLAENIKIHGSFNTIPPINADDEWSVPPTTALWSLILLPIFIGTLIVLHYLKRVRANRKLRNASNTSNSDITMFRCLKSKRQDTARTKFQKPFKSRVYTINLHIQE